MHEGHSLDELVAALDREDDAQILAQVEAALAIDSGVSLPDIALTEPDGAVDSKHHEDIRSLISKATLPEKVKLAMFGNSTCRTLLIRDANRLVQEFVLKNPRMQLKEIEDFSKNPNMAQGVLRLIAGHQSWVKSYAVKLNLVTNPKTPADIALKWLRFLNLMDLKKLSKSKNIPQVVALMAKKKVNDSEAH